MKDMLSKQVVGLKPSGIRKFFDIVSEMKDAISLGVGEPDFDTPWHVRDEGIYSLEKGRTFYTSNSGLMELRQEICNYIKRKQGVSYDPKHEVLITVGGSEAIDIGLRAVINPGGRGVDSAAELRILRALCDYGGRRAGHYRIEGRKRVSSDGRGAGKCHYGKD